jgi:DNA-binding CsgD family transcriptional regulator
VVTGSGVRAPQAGSGVRATQAGSGVRATQAGIARLTPRETEVLALVADGLTNRELMARLVVSEATVKTHVNRLLSKLGCTTRAQLVAAAFHAGLATAFTAT